MKQILICAVTIVCCFIAQAGSVAAMAQELTKVSNSSREVTEATKPGIAGGASSPDEMGNRRPLYRLRKSDVIEIKFNFASEFDQTLIVSESVAFARTCLQP